VCQRLSPGRLGADLRKAELRSSDCRARYPTLMLITLFLLSAIVVFAQDAKDASALVREVAESALAAKSWTIEGSIKYSNLKDNSTFNFAMRSATQSSFDQTGGNAPATIKCDGSSAWVISKPLRWYTKVPVAEYRNCLPIVSDWYQLPKVLGSPTLAGEGKFESEGQSKSCQLVHGVLPPKSLDESVERTLCVDLNRKLIVWEKYERKGETRTYTYARIDVDVNVPDSTFAFTPRGAAEIKDVQLPVLRPLGESSIPDDPAVMLPKVVARKPPELDEESRRHRIQGTVVLYVVISEKGLASRVRVFRSLSPSLDEQVVKAVRQWGFAPAKKNGVPVVFGALIAETIQQ
jgi:TonB family protein